jgi:hypothetical protein
MRPRLFIESAHVLMDDTTLRTNENGEVSIVVCFVAPVSATSYCLTLYPSPCLVLLADSFMDHRSPRHQ